MNVSEAGAGRAADGLELVTATVTGPVGRASSTTVQVAPASLPGVAASSASATASAVSDSVTPATSSSVTVTATARTGTPS